MVILAFAAPSIIEQNAVASASGQPCSALLVSNDDAIRRTQVLVEQLIKDSYPELTNADIQVQTFASAADYFRSGFSVKRFLFGSKMRYFIRVNPRVFALNAPEAGVRAILAHELAHVYDFHRRKRIRLLGLMRLAMKSYTACFERRTDLQAIRRGYGAGLKAYRLWLYQNIPAESLAEKRRNYFSPEELDAIAARRTQQPEVLEYWFKRVPRNLQELHHATH